MKILYAEDELGLSMAVSEVLSFVSIFCVVVLC